MQMILSEVLKERNSSYKAIGIISEGKINNKRISDKRGVPSSRDAEETNQIISRLHKKINFLKD